MFLSLKKIFVSAVSTVITTSGKCIKFSFEFFKFFVVFSMVLLQKLKYNICTNLLLREVFIFRTRIIMNIDLSNFNYGTAKKQTRIGEEDVNRFKFCIDIGILFILISFHILEC